MKGLHLDPLREFDLVELMAMLMDWWMDMCLDVLLALLKITVTKMEVPMESWGNFHWYIMEQILLRHRTAWKTEYCSMLLESVSYLASNLCPQQRRKYLSEEE